MLEFVLAKAKKGDPKSVMDAVDEFGWKNWMMNVGPVKGVFLDNAIRAKSPKWVMELGGYCGYSAVRIASQLGPDAKLISVDPSTSANAIARQLVELAGLTSKVEFLVQTSTDAIPTIKTRFGIDHLDLVFIDHIKDMYLTDLKLMETSGVIGSGTVLVADNVIFPGSPDYLEYVRASPLYTTVYHDSLLEYTHDKRDGVEVSIRK